MRGLSGNLSDLAVDSSQYDILLCSETLVSDLLHPFLSLITFAFRSCEIKRLLLDLDPYGGTDPLGMFPLFLKRTADVLSPRLSAVFRRLLRLGSFLACWRQANVTPIPQGS